MSRALNLGFFVVVLFAATDSFADTAAQGANMLSGKSKLYKIPSSWTQVKSPQDGVFGFKTQKNLDDGLRIVFKPFWLPNETAMDSANVSIKSLKNSKYKLLSGPTEVQIGKNPAIQSSYLSPKGLKTEQYTLRHQKGIVFEITAIGSEKNFKKEENSLQDFLTSFILE